MKGDKMINFTPDQVNSIKEQVEEIARIQQIAYKAGYKKGFEEGKRQALVSATKIFEEEERAKNWKPTDIVGEYEEEELKEVYYRDGRD
jgi:flagellar biosynthesis/type III secretory pathway protein FliH